METKTATWQIATIYLYCPKCDEEWEGANGMMITAQDLRGRESSSLRCRHCGYEFTVPKAALDRLV